MSKGNHWAGLKESGTLKGLQFLLWIYRTFGRGFYSVLLAPVALYFLIARPLARRASREFLKRHYQHYPKQWSRPPGLWHTLVHIYHFGQSILDKGIAWSGNIDESEFLIAEPTRVKNILADPRGQLIIGSHLGNLEYCRGFMQGSEHDKVINVLLYDKHAANFVDIMTELNPTSRVNVFQVTEVDIATTLLLKEKIAQGEWVFIAGDRIPVTGDNRTVDVNFMGHNAALPIGPYIFAQAMQCPVKLMFSFRKNDRIHFDVIDFSEKIVLPRKEKTVHLQHLAQRFADHLSEQAAMAPYQWFNFYPFWQAPVPTTSERQSAHGT